MWTSVLWEHDNLYLWASAICILTLPAAVHATLREVQRASRIGYVFASQGYLI